MRSHTRNMYEGSIIIMCEYKGGSMSKYNYKHLSEAGLRLRGSTVDTAKQDRIVVISTLVHLVFWLIVIGLFCVFHS